ncbi:MAG: polymer-forming cytoskeletal protein [Chloroflexota bacterium]
MKPLSKLFTLMLLFSLVFLPTRSAAAKDAFDGLVIFGQSYTLESGDTLEGDLVVIGGTATIEAGATVAGNIFITGGTLTVSGDVQGDIAVLGGSVTLRASAYVQGDLSTVGASLSRDEGAQIDGTIYNSATSWVQANTNGTEVIPAVPVARPPLFSFNIDPFWKAVEIFGQSLTLGLLAMFVMLFLAEHSRRVADAFAGQPLTAGGVGLLTVVLAPIALVLLAITLLLIPVAILAAALLVIAAIFGWIAVGLEIGERFSRAVNQNWHPSLSAGLGTFVLTLVSQTLTAIPILNCIGFLIPLLVGLAGLGAVIVTRFGTQSLSLSAQSHAPVPVAAPPVTVQPVEAPPVESAAPPKRKPRAKKTG